MGGKVGGCQLRGREAPLPDRRCLACDAMCRLIFGHCTPSSTAKLEPRCGRFHPFLAAMRSVRLTRSFRLTGVVLVVVFHFFYCRSWPSIFLLLIGFRVH